MKRFLRFHPLMGAAAVLLVSCSLLLAQPSSVPSITLNAPGLGVALTHTPSASAFQLAADGKTWELKPRGQFNLPGAPFFTVQDLRFDPDPIIYAGAVVNNVTAAPQTFTFVFNLPTTFAAPNYIRGSIATSLVGTDASLSAPSGSSVYSAQIDGNTVQTLQAFPFALTTPQAAVSSTAQFGFNLSNVPVNSSLGIAFNFTLSPGDMASIVADFEVVAVPEPGVAALLLMGAALWLRRSRA